MLVSGDITIKVSSQDYMDWQLLENDGTTAVPVSTATSIELILENLEDGVVTTHKTTDVPQKLYITDAVLGKIQFRPETSDFDNKTSYKFHIKVNDSIGGHFVPRNKYHIITVI